jgi:hypothetical protein
VRFLALIAALAAVPAAAQDYRQRLPQDEVIYFVLPDRFENADPANDRGGLSGDKMRTGFDPAHKGFYHGGDLKGLVKRLPCRAGQDRKAPDTTVTGSPISLRSTRIWAPTTTSRRWSMQRTHAA